MFSFAAALVLFQAQLTVQFTDKEALPSATNVSLVFIGTRVGSGYRTPGKFFNNDKNLDTWAYAGPNGLTNVGKEQAYSLGQFLRKRYADQISSLFFPAQFKAYSSSAERLQQILQLVLAGLYEPRGKAVFNKSLDWQPIPYEINDPLMRMNNVKCPTYTDAYKAIGDDTLDESKVWLKSKSEVIKYIADNSGLNETLNDLAEAADNVQGMIVSKVSLPSWIENPTLKGYTKEKLIKEILTFTEAHQVQCAKNAACAKSVAGLWLNQIIDLLNKRKSGNLQERRVLLYSGQTETVMSLMTSLKINISKVITSTGFILEFITEPPSVRVFSHVADKENPSIRRVELIELPYCSDKEWCPLEKFTENVASGSFKDLREFCKLSKCE